MSKKRERSQAFHEDEDKKTADQIDKKPKEDPQKMAEEIAKEVKEMNKKADDELAEGVGSLNAAPASSPRHSSLGRNPGKVPDKVLG